MRKLLFLTVAIVSVFVSVCVFSPNKVYAEEANVYDIAEVTTIAPGGELELYNKCLMTGTKTLSAGDSVNFAFKIGNFEKVTRVAFCIGSYGVYFYKNNNDVLKFMTCGYADGAFTRGSVVATESDTDAIKEYVNAALKIETLSESKTRISLTYTISGTGKTVNFDYDTVSSSDMLIRYCDAGNNQYSEFFIKSLLPAEVFGDGSFEYVNYNNNAANNISGKCLLGVVGKDVADKFGVPAGYTGNILKIEGLTPTGSLDMSFDFTSANIVRARIRSVKFRIYVCKTSADTGSYPVLRVPDTGSTSSFQAYAIGQNTDKWLDIEFSAAQIDKLCTNGKLEKFTLWLRTNARTITYIDNFVVDLIPLDEEAPVITAPVTEFNVAEGAYPFDDAVTVTDNSGVADVKKVWSENALDKRGRLTAGVHTCKIIATDPSGNVSELTLTYNVYEESGVKKYKITFRFEGFDDVTAEYYEGGEEYLEIPEIPEKENYIIVWDNFILKKTQNQVVEGRYVARTVKLKYMADGELYLEKEVAFNAEYDDPAVPEKKGYAGKWQDYDLDSDEAIINAEYTIIEYVIDYYVGDEKVASLTYTVEDENVTAPEVPSKKYYNGSWEAYELNCENLTVRAFYTPIIYTVTYVADDVVVATVTYSIETKEFEIPEVPKKAGYVGKWEEHSFDFENKTVKAVYTETGENQPSDGEDFVSTSCSSAFYGGELFLLLGLVAVVAIVRKKQNG